MARVCSRCGGTMTGAPRSQCAGCLLRLAALPEALAPEYEIETLLGRGRAGTTYLARAEGSGTLLAVKILNVRDEQHDAPGATDAVRSELTSFDHPAVARTRAVDVDEDGNARLVRDYVAGKPFAAWVQQADRLQRSQAFDAIASSLLAAHARGLFHGHVAASNIIVASGGRPILVDLGAHMVLLALQGVTPAPVEMARRDLDDLNAIREAVP